MYFRKYHNTSVTAIIWPHRAHNIDAAYCCSWGSVVCLSVCLLCVGYDREPGQNSWTDRDAVWDVDCRGVDPNELTIVYVYHMGSRSPHGMGTFDCNDISKLITSHAVDQRSDWSATEAVWCHIKFPKMLIRPVGCGLSLLLFYCSFVHNKDN